MKQKDSAPRTRTSGAKPPSPAKLTISEVLLRFFVVRSQRLSETTSWNYLWVLVRFQEYLDGNAYNCLDRAQAKLFDDLFGRKGGEHREFCEIFGPEHILDHLYGFTEDYYVEKVMSTERSQRQARAVIKKLEKWLIDLGYVRPRNPGARPVAHASRPPLRPAGDFIDVPPQAPPMSVHEIREAWAKLTGRSEE